MNNALHSPYLAMQGHIYIPRSHCVNLKICISGAIRGIDTIWFIADDFGFKSYQKYYYQREPEVYGGYVKVHFEMSAYLNNKMNSLDNNTASCLRNVLVAAIQVQVQLPKIIVIVPDDDLLTFLDYNKYGKSVIYGKVTDWIMTQHDRLLATQKEYLPLKAKSTIFPKVVWILPPLHTNFNNNTQRSKFGKEVEKMAVYHENVYALALKKIWDEHDTKLFVKETDRFTSDGYKRYWEAVDKTVKYADTILFKKQKIQKKKSPKKPQNKQLDHGDRN